MARRNWTKCKCGAKLRVKTGHTTCFICEQKQRKG